MPEFSLDALRFFAFRPFDLTTMAVYIASAKRTAFGAFGGSLKSLTASQVRLSFCDHTLANPRPVSG